MRRPLFWIILLAVFLRLAFIFGDDPTPVQFDARIYVSCALTLPVALMHPTLLFDQTAREKISYDLLYADRLSGENVYWLYYDPPDFTAALEGIFFAGPVYPGILGLLFLPDWHDFAAARVANVVFDALTCGLLFWLLTVTVNRRVALWGAALFAIYPGAIIKCGELNIEPLAACLTTGAVALCISALLHDRPRRYLGAGLVAALLLLTKAASAGLVVFLGLALIIILFRQRRLLTSALWRLGLGFSILSIPWIILIWVLYGTPSVRDPNYGAANFRSSNMLENHGYDLDAARHNFWTYSVWREMTTRPGEYLQLYLEKFYRLWNRSYNDYRLPVVIGVQAQTWFHRLIVLLAIIGLFFWPTRATRYAALLVVAAVAYVSLTHTIWHSLTRYALVAMPLVCGAAAVGGTKLAARAKHHLSIKPAAIFGGAVLLTLLSWSWLDTGQVLVWAKSLHPLTANSLVVVIRALVLTLDSYLLCRYLGQTRRVVWLFVCLMLIGQGLLVAKSLPPERWAEWSVELSSSQQVVERVIHLPPGYRWDKHQEFFLLADLQSGGGEEFTLHLQLDSMRQEFSGGQYSGLFYPKPAYKPFVDAYGLKKEQFRHWVAFPLRRGQVDTLVQDNRVLVRIRVDGGDKKTNFVRVFGDYRTSSGGRGGDWVGPTWLNPSVERLYEEGDARIWEAIPRQLVRAENRMLVGGRVDTGDLSPASGIQTGDYRMMIIAVVNPRKNVYF